MNTKIKQQFHPLVCFWFCSNGDLVHLQDTLTKWQNFMSEQKLFSDWLTQKESTLGKMQLVENADPKELIDLVKTLKVSDSRPNGAKAFERQRN